MRVALKIAYDGRAFYGHQRQPDRRTVEGECLAALRAAHIVDDPHEAFFRSASRTDRGVSAVGNIIAFNTLFRTDAIVGAFNHGAQDVWAWALASVPDSFHPRHAIERWYRYMVVEDIAPEVLRSGARLFVGTHDFRSFCSEPLLAPFTVNSVDVIREDGVTCIDVRARSFRRGMVRRIVGALLAVARGDASCDQLQETLAGVRRDFGSAPPEPLVLMDVRYEVPFRAAPSPKVTDDLQRRLAALSMRQRILQLIARRYATELSQLATIRSG